MPWMTARAHIKSDRKITGDDVVDDVFWDILKIRKVILSTDEIQVGGNFN